MYSHPLNTVKFYLRNIGKNHNIYRNIRNIKRNDVEPKLLKGKVVTVKNDDPDFLSTANNFDDFKTKMKRMFVEDDDLEMEKALTNDEDYSYVLEKGHEMHDLHIMDEKESIRKGKQYNIKRKYFKEEPETNLLTCAAKKQIRYLHQLDPMQWTPQILSESFPISVNGVKKLLKNNFVHTSPERIKQHDEEVSRRWKILKTGNFSSEISPVTQMLWKEGKLQQENYSGNLFLPVAPKEGLDSKPHKVERKHVGEHLAIVKTFLDYKQNKAMAINENKNNIKSAQDDSTNNVCSDRDADIRKGILPKLRLRYPSADELEDQKSASYLASRQPEEWEPEIPHSQFQSNLKEELSMKKDETGINKDYESWMKKQEEEYNMQTSRKPYNSSDFFTKIQKYERKSVELNKDRDKEQKPAAYYYDEHLGYQYPMGKTAKRKIKIPLQKYKKGSLYQVKDCVYDDDGQLLYKLPMNKSS